MSLPPYIEPIGSRAWQNLSCTYRFKFTTEYDTTTARNTVLTSIAPPTHGEFIRNDESLRVHQEPDGTVAVEVDYFHESLPEANIPLRSPDDPPEASFDTTGGTGKRTQKISLRDWALTAIGTDVLKYIHPEDPDPAPPVAPADPDDWVLKDEYLFDGAIGVTPDHDVEGVDLVVPKLALSYRKLWLRSAVTTAYIKTLARMTGKTNNAAFKGFDAEELLFLGARGQTQGAFYSIEYVFDASENIDDFVVPGANFQPTPIVKFGHDYFWVWYQRVRKDDEKLVRPKPIIAYVDQVYYTGDFSLLGIGT
jgi:hypothetical protein